MSLPCDLISMSGAPSKRQCTAAVRRLAVKLYLVSCHLSLSLACSLALLFDTESLPSSFLPQALEPAASLHDSFTANNLNSYQSARPINELNIPVKPGLSAAEYETMPDILPLKPLPQHKGMRSLSLLGEGSRQHSLLRIKRGKNWAQVGVSGATGLSESACVSVFLPLAARCNVSNHSEILDKGED